MTLDEMREALTIFAKYSHGDALAFGASHDEIHFYPDRQPNGEDATRLGALGFHRYGGKSRWTAFA